MSPDYFPSIDDDEIINERNKMMGYMILFFLEEEEKTKDLRKELHEMRDKDPELQATFTILNNRPHNDNKVIFIKRMKRKFCMSSSRVWQH